MNKNNLLKLLKKHLLLCYYDRFMSVIDEESLIIIDYNNGIEKVRPTDSSITFAIKTAKDIKIALLTAFRQFSDFDLFSADKDRVIIKNNLNKKYYEFNKDKKTYIER